MESSRVFVKGLPPKLSENDVRKHFAKFPITDVKFFPHRRIGYIGYKTPEDAAQAVKYFNKSFIRMSKIFVEIARPVCSFHGPTTDTVLTTNQVADQQFPKSLTQRQEHDGATRDLARVSTAPKDSALKRKRPDDEAAQDPKLKEFLEVMQPPSKTKMWANDEGQAVSEMLPAAETNDKAAAPEDESDGEYQKINKKPKTSHTTKEPSIEVQADPEKEKVPTPSAEESQSRLEEVSVVPGGESGPVSDADWLRSRTNRVLDLVEDDEIPSRTAAQPSTVPDDAEEAEEQPAEPDNESPQQKSPEVADPDVANSEPSEMDKIRENGRLYLRNLHFDVSSDDLQDHFSKYGPLEEVSSEYLSLFDLLVMMNPDRDNRCFAFEVNLGEYFSRCLSCLKAAQSQDLPSPHMAAQFADYSRCMCQSKRATERERALLSCSTRTPSTQSRRSG
jgi:multiple RNA-binding domain-containing protein 1